MTKYPWAAVLAGSLVACSVQPTVSSHPPTEAARSPAGLDIVPLDVRSDTKIHRFSVEVARTETEQAKGLMFRQTLGSDDGMIFPFNPPRPASFWMKDTMIALDIVFIRPDGTIARIADNATPYSLDPIPEAEPVAGVLEIAGGRAAQLGIEEGDHVSWPGGPALPN